MLRLSLLAVALVTLGCGKNDKAATGTGTPAVAETAKTEAPPASASASTTASAAASASAPAEPAPTAMYLFAKNEAGLLAAVPSARGALIATIEPFDENPPAVVVDGDDVEPVTKLFAGVGRQDDDYKAGNHVRALAGRYPDDLYASVEQVGGRSGSEGYYYRREGTGWSQSLGPDAGQLTFVGGNPAAVKATAIEPLLLGIQGTNFGFPGADPGNEEGCTAGRRSFNSTIALAGTPNGELFMLSYKCGDDATPVVDFWKKGSVGSKTTEVPFVQPQGALLVARAADDAYVGGLDEKNVGSLAHFDGKAWKREQTIEAGVIDLALAADGTLWVLTSTGVMRRPPGGAFTTLAFPADGKGAEPEHVVASSGTLAWAYGQNVVFSTKRPKKVVSIDASALGPKGATADCKTVFVQLYAITKMTPPNFDFPKTREAMKGHAEFEGARFVVTKDDRFGAVVKSLDQGKALKKLAEAGVRGARPQVLCLKPDEAREVKFDLATGKMK